VLITIAGVFAASLILVPVLGFQYTFWRMHRILDAVSEEELINRTKDLPEVRAYLAKYENSTVRIDTDFHVGVDYLITECDVAAKNCGGFQPHLAHLSVRISLDSGYPEKSIFWCRGDRVSFAVADPAMVEIVRKCN
jgi:hypothetical protein